MRGVKAFMQNYTPDGWETWHILFYYLLTDLERKQFNRSIFQLVSQFYFSNFSFFPFLTEDGIDFLLQFMS